MSKGGKKCLCFVFFLGPCQHRKWIPMWRHQESSDSQCWFPLETVWGIKGRCYKVPISEWFAQPALPELLSWSRRTQCVFCSATGPRKGRERCTPGWNPGESWRRQMFGDEAGCGIVYSTAADPENGEGEHIPCLRSRLGPVRRETSAPTAASVYLRNPAGTWKGHFSGCL